MFESMKVTSKALFDLMKHLRNLCRWERVLSRLPHHPELYCWLTHRLIGPCRKESPPNPFANSYLLASRHALDLVHGEQRND
jgi:hypothetical protein